MGWLMALPIMPGLHALHKTELYREVHRFGKKNKKTKQQQQINSYYGISSPHGYTGF